MSLFYYRLQGTSSADQWGLNNLVNYHQLVIWLLEFLEAVLVMFYKHLCHLSSQFRFVPFRYTISSNITEIKLKILTPLLSIASFNICTTSFPTTFEQLKPFVHLSNMPTVKPLCERGKLNVKPRGSFWSATFSSLTKMAKHSAMWSKSCSPEPSMMCCGMAKILDFISKCSTLSSINRTLKFVPPRSSARNFPVSERNNEHVMKIWINLIKKWQFFCDHERW